jgi:dihydrofolate reductase
MGRIVVSEFVTLDGVMEDPGGSEHTPFGGWAFRFERGSEGDRFKLEELQAADALLLGRRTYDGFAAAWPSIEDEQGFAERMNGLPKYVVSSTLADPTWNATAIGLEQIEELEGTLLVAGSQQLTQTLFERGLVDEVRLVVYPTVLGAGKKLFETPSDFTLVSAVPSEQVILVTLAKS